MPLMDGITATREIVSKYPIPIIILTSSVNTKEKYRVFDALKYGAIEIMEKPSPIPGFEWDEIVLPLIEKVKHAKEINLIKRRVKEEKKKDFKLNFKKGVQVISIASSTGGPSVLNDIFSNLKKDFKIPIIVAQHISKGFTEGLVRWLDQNTPLKVEIASSEKKLEETKIFFPPDGAHITSDGENVKPVFSPPIRGIRPSADILFETVSSAFGDTAIGIVLTGMGSDGSKGIKKIKEMGGVTIAQKPETATISSMPENAIKSGFIDYILPPKEIAYFLNTLG